MSDGMLFTTNCPARQNPVIFTMRHYQHQISQVIPASYVIANTIAAGIALSESLVSKLTFQPVTTVSRAFENFEIKVQDVPHPSGSTLRRLQPLILHAKRSQSGDCYQACVPDLDIPLVAVSREEMIAALQDLIVVLWDEYALENDANLTPKAKELKGRLLRDFDHITS